MCRLRRQPPAMYNRPMQLDALMLLIYVLTTARLTALATGTDEITRPYVRGTYDDDGETITPGLVGRINPQELEHGWRHLLAYLLTCQWCASTWIGLALAPVALWHGSSPWALAPALGLAFSQVTGMLSKMGRD
jgi:uncharacterized protein DUF1360